MRLLILGGTRFLGKATAGTASAAGWDVTTFNRGRSGSDLPGMQAIRGDRGAAADLAGLRSRGRGMPLSIRRATCEGTRWRLHVP
jgi:2'-hydroxyisoflavone reductase